TLLVAAALSLFTANAIETVDELVGYYAVSASYECGRSADSWSDYTDAYKSTISKTGENTITINNFCKTGDTFTGTVDTATGTITLTPQFSGYYTYCGEPDEYGTDGYGRGLADTTKPIVGTINADGSITFKYVASYYSESSEENRIYMIFTDVFTKSATPEWTTQGHYAFYEIDYDTYEYNETPTFVGEGTILKYTDEDAETLGYQYEIRISRMTPDAIYFDTDEDIIEIKNEDLYTYDGYSYLDCYYFVPNYAYSLVTFSPEEDDNYFESTGESGGLVDLTAYFYPDYYDYYTYYGGKFEFAWGESDAVTTIKADKEDENAPVFDIMGRRVTDTTAPGIYIKNGKKFIVF
ncbi:MAG: hypothetical protein ACI4AH_01050, partial [Muribaculaceae bacterium]